MDLPGLEHMEDEAAVEHLTAAKGIGRWTAEVYLLFSMKRPDVFPGGDLALQAGLQRLLALPERPGAAEAAELAQRWSPERSAAARFLWHFYHHEAGF